MREERKAAGGRPRVGIFGGGIAGLTTAHELIEAGFDATVYDAAPSFGGKAYSYTTIIKFYEWKTNCKKSS